MTAFLTYGVVWMGVMPIELRAALRPALASRRNVRNRQPLRFWRLREKAPELPPG